MNNYLNKPIIDRMRELEEINSEDAEFDREYDLRLRQVPAETGEFLALLANVAPEGNFIEVGTSAGYSALWISLACRKKSAKLTTFEILPNKIDLARETIFKTNSGDYIELVSGDARGYLDSFDNISFCFLDATSDVYIGVYEKVVPRLVKGGILVADNAISHRQEIESVIARAEEDPRVDSSIIGVGKGEMVVVKK
ncbi:O-methyltransferase [Halomonas sp. IOP_31]|uniref:O-methyltransferase n=1 Tax=Halomonas sp. IOP_31 TaxID=2876584 RepID=UPI001E2FEE8B|nr:class I SAM-dependent methyltransferase [Halomonas sp. IOP_31]MCD6007972.1 class I SAM-dependent methyltransferase [Halomonas sp. IOP_31]